MERQDTNHDIYTDPAIANARTSEDPFSKFIATNWRAALVTIAIALVGYYFMVSFKDTQLKARVSSSDLFTEAQYSWDELLNLQQSLDSLTQNIATKKPEEISQNKTEIEKKIVETKARFSQQLTALSDVNEPYNKLADLYREINAIRSGDIAAAKNALSNIKDNVGKSTDPRALLSLELAELMLARSLIDNQATYKEGRDILKKLATSGTYAFAIAAVTFSKISNTPDEIKEAKELLDLIASTHPEQLDIIKEQKERVSNL